MLKYHKVSRPQRDDAEHERRSTSRKNLSFRLNCKSPLYVLIEIYANVTEALNYIIK